MAYTRSPSLTGVLADSPASLPLWPPYFWASTFFINPLIFLPSEAWTPLDSTLNLSGAEQ